MVCLKPEPGRNHRDHIMTKLCSLHSRTLPLLALLLGNLWWQTGYAAVPVVAAQPATVAPPSVTQEKPTQTSTPAQNQLPYSRLEIRQLILRQAYRLNIAAPLALAVAKVGANFQTRGVLRPGVIGVMQLPVQAFSEPSGDRSNQPAGGPTTLSARLLQQPRINIRLGVRYLARLLHRYAGKQALALSHYYLGYPLYHRLLNTVDPSSRLFVDEVLRWQARYREQARLWGNDNGVVSRVASHPHGVANGNSDMYGPETYWPATYDFYSCSDCRAPRYRRNLDDFDRNIELRQQRARHALDDFYQFSENWVPNRWESE